MTTQESYDRIKNLRREFSAVRTSVQKSDYATALVHMRRAESLAPKIYDEKDPFASAYDMAWSRIRAWNEAITNSTKRSFNQAYNKASDALDRIAKGRDISQSTIRAIKEMESAANRFDLGSVPQEVGDVVKDQFARIADLKKELETYSRSRGVKIDWDAK